MRKAMRLAMIGVGVAALGLSSGCGFLLGGALGAGAGYAAGTQQERERNTGYWD